MTTPANIDLVHLARELNLPLDKVQRTLELLDDGNTIPFITRFRKDQTGGLNEEQVQRIQSEAAKERLLAERKQTILRSVESQGKLTPEIAGQIQSARTLKWLEDVYFPFKPKKQTLATLARERGLEPLARRILAAEPAVNDLAPHLSEFVNPEKGLHSANDVLQAVRYLIAEHFSERPDMRGRLRKLMRRTGVLTSVRIEGAERGETASTAAGETSHAIVAARLQAGQSPEPPGSAVPPAGTTDSQPPEGPPAAVTAGPASGGESSSEDGGDSVSAPRAAAPVVAAGPLAEPPGVAASPEGLPSAGTAAAEDPAAASGSRPAETEGSQVSGGASAALPARPGPLAAVRKPSNEKRQKRKQAAKERKRRLFEHAFKDYYDFREPISRLPPHRILAVNRGEKAKVLRVRIDCPMEEMLQEAMRLAVPESHPHAGLLAECVRDALQRLIMPSLERELRRELTEEAEEHAVKVFAGNLRKLLLQPPVRGRRVIAIDPAFRSGCKLVALDEFGGVLEHASLHVVGSEEHKAQSRTTLADVIRRQHIGIVAIGNGTACRETEQLVSDVIATELRDHPIAYVIVNEAGASVYSTSQIGREELPDCDAVLRSAISIGRRLLDPLSELVKINPANIGVGMYQHDVKAKHLRESLDSVVNSCVNFVGVDVNTASPSLLSYVSGLNQLTARRLYDYRREHGPFRNREEIKSVPGIGDATFVQAAGFLKITLGDNPLDATWIHPESYAGAYRVLEKLQIPLSELIPPPSTATPSRGPVPSPAEPTGLLPEVPAGQEPTPPPAGESQLEHPQAVAVESPSTASGVACDTFLPDEASGQVSGESVPDLVEAGGGPLPPSPEPAAGHVPAAEAAVHPTGLAPPGATPRSASPPDAPPCGGAPLRPQLAERLAHVNIAEISKETHIGELTLRDILAALSRPGRDPRDDFSPPPFRTGIMKLDDLKPGMELQGTVLNVVDFGAFVDIGISDSALIHISKLADRFIRDPQEVVSVGDILKVWVLNVDRERRRVSLTAIDPHAPPRPREHHERRPKRSKPAPSTSQPAPPARAGGQPPAAAPPRRRPPKSGQAKPRTPPPKRPPKPMRPITSAMLSGKQPMRSFSDLLQYYEKKSQDGDQSLSQN